jgi:hypothetical protein
MKTQKNSLIIKGWSVWRQNKGEFAIKHADFAFIEAGASDETD